MKKAFTRWFLQKVFGRQVESYSCANRVGARYLKGEYEVTIVRRDTRKPDAHSREELYRMAKIIRTEQERTGWDVFSCFD